MINDANYYNQGTADDNLLMAFKDSMEAANSGKFYLVDSLLKAQDTVAAKIMNDNISPDFNGDYNQKILNQIYTDTWARNVYTLSADQISILESIAYQNPVYGGTAVYGARVMLDLEIEDDITTGARNAYAKPIQAKTPKINNDNLLLTIYPVPVENELFIESKSILNGQLVIINQLGQEVYNQQIKNINRLKINTESFSAGIYQVRFNSIDNLIIMKNFIVSK